MRFLYILGDYLAFGNSLESVIMGKISEDVCRIRETLQYPGCIGRSSSYKPAVWVSASFFMLPRSFSGVR